MHKLSGEWGLISSLTLEYLTCENIEEMDARTLKLRNALEREAAILRLPITLRQTGSIM
jgi:hypothetical protein